MRHAGARKPTARVDNQDNRVSLSPQTLKHRKDTDPSWDRDTNSSRPSGGLPR